ISIRQYICYTSNNLGELKFWLGEYDEAEKLFREQLNIATELGIKRHISIAYNCLGNISRKKQDFVTAENFYDKAIAIGEELNVQTILCEYYYEKASLFYEMEKLGEALELVEKALKMSAEVNRLDFHFRSELLKWKIISHSDREKAVEMMGQMMNTNTKNENIAELNYHLYMLTLDEDYFKKAMTLFEGLYNEAPKAAYRERIESLKSMKG
ncbi:MAG TPA: tetratricopeptide repeat protein, partial [bacterium]|nr:tetratricopeptide repeat protein [bacterium]